MGLNLLNIFVMGTELLYKPFRTVPGTDCAILVVTMTLTVGLTIY